jgi:hypothetical protein
MTGSRLAVWIIGTTYVLFGLLVILFATIVSKLQVNIGVAYLIAVLMGGSVAVAAAGLFGGSVLGTLALARHSGTPRLLHVLAIFSGWVGALVLGWFAWQFWSHSFLPKVAP